MAVASKTPVVLRDDYIMYLEYFNDFLWFHTDIKKWTPKVKVKFLEDLNLLRYLVNVPLLAFVEKDNKKLAKFGKVLGWEIHQEVKLDNGTEAYIFMWSK